VTSDHWPSIAITTAGPVMSDVWRRRKLHGASAILTKSYVPLWREANIRVVTLELDSLAEGAQLLEEIDESSGTLLLASRGEIGTTSDAIEILLAPSALAFDDVAGARLWAGLGAAVCCLAYNLRNPFCDGVGETRDGGLSELGRALVRRLEALDVLIDVSHLSDASLSDLLEVSKKPLIASHSNARSLCPNPRNLTDEQAREITNRAGLVAVSVHPTLLTEDEATIHTYVDHVCYFAELVGVENVALGADFIGFALDIVAPKLARSDPNSGIYRQDSLVATSLASYESLSGVGPLLMERGLSTEDVTRIAYGNYLRVLNRRSGV
jgi:microsomal dipeptidase-like Zn-dependent dipeptidase